MAETALHRPKQPHFELKAGNLSLDFINTLDNRPGSEPKELIENYYDLVRFGEETGLLTPEQLDRLVERAHSMPDEAEEAVRRARDLREALHEIFSALMNEKVAPQSAVDALNANLHDTALHSRLVQTNALENKTLHAVRLEWRSDDLASSFNAILWPIARAGGDLLASSDTAMVRTCSSPTCQWFFLDTSKNHRRRWCDMKVCGNRAKVRKFYAKRKAV